MKKILLSIITVLLSLSYAFAQTSDEDVAKGKEYMKLEMFDTAFNYFIAAAQHKNYEGMYFAGNMYTHGVGTAVDRKRAYFWLRYSADSGSYPRAYEALGTLYYQDKKMDSAKYFLEKAMEFTLSSASTLGIIYYDEGEVRKALRLFREGADAGDPVAMYYLGQMYYDGEEMEPNEKEAVRWMQRAAVKEYKPAIEYLEDLGYDDLEHIDDLENPKKKSKKKAPAKSDEDKHEESEDGKKVKLNKKSKKENTEDSEEEAPKRKSKKKYQDEEESGDKE